MYRHVPLRSGASLAILLALALPAPARAFESRDIACSSIRQVTGGFTFRPEPGFSVRALVSAPGPFVHGLGDDVVAFVCMRTDPIPEVDDVEVLQAGFMLTISGSRTGMRRIELTLAQGRVSYEVLDGELSGRERGDLDRIIAAMQARVDAAPEPGHQT